MRPNDLEALKEFLDDLRKLLKDVVDKPRPLIPGRHHEALKEAWGSIELKFENVKMEINTNLWSTLMDHGLTGVELDFKLKVFQHARDDLLDYGLAKDGDPKDPAYWPPFAWLFRRALKGANVILGSLAKIIPVAEPIREFKEAIEASIDKKYDKGDIPIGSFL